MCVLVRVSVQIYVCAEITISILLSRYYWPDFRTISMALNGFIMTLSGWVDFPASSMTCMHVYRRIERQCLAAIRGLTIPRDANKLLAVACLTASSEGWDEYVPGRTTYERAPSGGPYTAFMSLRPRASILCPLLPSAVRIALCWFVYL